MSRFATDTAVTPLGDGRYEGSIDRAWWIQRGPNGGYLAAIVLRSILAEVADEERRVRSLTLHYLRPPVEGPCEVAVTVERAGRGMSTVTARLVQDGIDKILAIAALGVERPGPPLDDVEPPDAPPPERVAAPVDSAGPAISIRDRYETRPVLGMAPFERRDRAETGGWIRTTDADPVDDVLLAALTDAWPPAIFSRLEVPVGVPTVDLTIHFRHEPPRASEWCFVRFRTTVATAGYLEEDGEVWSQDGRLLAQSRQLAVVVAPD